MKVLNIGQLPKEIGGNYTTGAANVLFELSKCNAANVKSFTFGTNINEEKAKANSSYPNQYIGYSLNPIYIIVNFICNIRTNIKALKHFIKIDHSNPLRYYFYKVNIERAIKKVSPDIIHIHSIKNISPTYFAIEKKAIPLVLTCHGIFYRGENNKILKNRYLGNIPLANYYTGLTEESVYEYNTYLGLSSDKISIIPNGVDCNKFYFDPSERESIRAKIGIDKDTIVFITVASLQSRKGQYDFIKILSKLNINYQYWIIGDGIDKDKIKKYINENNLENRIKLFGYISPANLRKYYNAADIYAHVSKKEGQALCQIEAYACGLRTLVSKSIVKTLPFFDNQDVFVLTDDNINQEALIKWSLNNNTRASRNTLDWHNIFNRYIEIYNNVIKNNGIS